MQPCFLLEELEMLLVTSFMVVKSPDVILGFTCRSHALRKFCQAIRSMETIKWAFKMFLAAVNFFK